MEVAVIADRVPFVRDTLHEIGPTLRMPAEDEERGFDVSFGERVEDARRRVWIGAVVERESDTLARSANRVNRRTKDWTILPERAVRGGAAPLKCA